MLCQAIGCQNELTEDNRSKDPEVRQECYDKVFGEPEEWVFKGIYCYGPSYGEV